jgi:hydroxyacyl-ACP dehydratase HTD2-like protein with hotdog domain
METEISRNVSDLIGVEKLRMYEVTAPNVRRFAQAIGLNEVESGIDGCLVAPPLFCQIFMFEDLPVDELPDDGSPKELDVPIPAKRSVGGESDFEIFEEVKAGDVITVSSILRNVRARQGRSGPLYLVVVETTFQNQHNRVVARETATYVKRR